MAADNLFAKVLQTPAVRSLPGRLAAGGVLSFTGVNPAAQPFFAVLLRRVFPGSAIVVVADGVKAQENFHQEIETWLDLEDSISPGAEGKNLPAARARRHLYYPSWDILPHESRLPHANVISVNGSY